MLKNVIKINYYGVYGNILVRNKCGWLFLAVIDDWKTIQKPRRIQSPQISPANPFPQHLYFSIKL